MAIAYNTHKSCGRAITTNSCTYTCSSGSDRLLIAYVGWYNGQSISACTYNGVAMTVGASINPSGGQRGAAVYYLLSPATGANTLSASCTPGGQYLYLAGSDYTGVLGFDASNTEANASSSSQTIDITTVADNCWLMMAHMYANTAGTVTAGTDTTKLHGYLEFHSFNGGPRASAGAHSLIANNTTARGSRSAICSFSPVPTTGQAGYDDDHMLGGPRLIK